MCAAIGAVSARGRSDQRRGGAPRQPHPLGLSDRPRQALQGLRRQHPLAHHRGRPQRDHLPPAQRILTGQRPRRQHRRGLSRHCPLQSSSKKGLPEGSPLLANRLLLSSFRSARPIRPIVRFVAVVFPLKRLQVVQAVTSTSGHRHDVVNLPARSAFHSVAILPVVYPRSALVFATNRWVNPRHDSPFPPHRCYRFCGEACSVAVTTTTPCYHFFNPFSVHRTSSPATGHSQIDERRGDRVDCPS
jgi:hypothetical protein